MLAKLINFYSMLALRPFHVLLIVACSLSVPSALEAGGKKRKKKVSSKRTVSNKPVKSPPAPRVNRVKKKAAPTVTESEASPPPNGLNSSIFDQLGFQMAAIEGWTVEGADGYDNIVFVNEKKEEGSRYAAKIQVTRLEGQIYLSDEEVVEEFKTKIQDTMVKTGYVQGFSFFNQEKTVLSDGTEAALYYSSMKIKDIDVMQAHLVIPAEQHHFLLSYTDRTEFIDGDKSDKYYQKIWPVLYSFIPFDKQLPPKTFWEKWKIWFMIFGLILLTGGTLRYINRYVPENDLDALLDNDFGDDEAYVSSQMELDKILAQKAKKYKGKKKKDPFEKLEDAVGMGSMHALAEDDVDSSDLLEDEDELIAI